MHDLKVHSITKQPAEYASAGCKSGHSQAILSLVTDSQIGENPFIDVVRRLLTTWSYLFST